MGLFPLPILRDKMDQETCEFFNLNTPFVNQYLSFVKLKMNPFLIELFLTK